MRISEYLIGNGWLPSPTIRDESAWEHPDLGKVPTAFTAGIGLYGYGEARMPETAALFVQLVHERQGKDSLLRDFWRISSVVENTAKYFVARTKGGLL